MTRKLYLARALLADARTYIDGGALLVEGGRVAAVVASRAARTRAALTARVVDLGDVLLAPGWINAHAHLELGTLRGRTPRGGDFGAWIGAVLRAKATCVQVDFERAIVAGAEELLSCGTTSVFDIDSTSVSTPGRNPSAMRVWTMREVLDAFDPARTRSALRRIARALPRRARRYEGISPHASFTVSPELLRATATLARRRSAPVAIHWSETEAEVRWLRAGSGPLAALLGPSPRTSGLDLLESAGLLARPLALIHGNHPAPGEAARIAAVGAVVVHCPGSHAWFARAPFPWRVYRRAGVRVALGTDSLASNERLDMAREMRLVRESAPWLAPEEVFEMATLDGARAVGRENELGVLRRGARADFVAHTIEAHTRAEALEALTMAESSVLGVWVDGRAAGPSPERGTAPARRVGGAVRRTLRS